ncbi:hypothetical protein D083_0853 [Dickeya solani RNS 08.23.3.1.A]|nr:hypothetical protein D083_0853 [Dickeya solani RNS 08.23.3.1.A]
MIINSRHESAGEVTMPRFRPKPKPRHGYLFRLLINNNRMRHPAIPIISAIALSETTLIADCFTL